MMKTCVYGLCVDGLVYRHNPTVRGEQFTLVTAMREAAGTANCRVVELMPGGYWRTVVDRAGSMHDARHVGSGYHMLRRSVTPFSDCDRFGTWNRRRAYERLLASFGITYEPGTEDVTGGGMSFAEVKKAANA